MKLLVGLGNPGAEYAATRHNIGFLALDALHEHLNTNSWQRKFHGTLASAGSQDNKLLLLKPQTFMNRSGLAVGEACQYYKIQPADVLVFHDELELPPGRVRVKQGGGHAGHNGLKSLDAAIGADYWRIRLGIGRPPPERESVHDYVLQPFAKTDRDWLTALLAVLSREIDLLLSSNTSEYMNKITLALQGVLPQAPDMEKE